MIDLDPANDGMDDLAHAVPVELVKAPTDLGGKVLQSADYERQLACGVDRFNRRLLLLLELRQAQLQSCDAGFELGLVDETSGIAVRAEASSSGDRAPRPARVGPLRCALGQCVAGTRPPRGSDPPAGLSPDPIPSARAGRRARLNCHTWSYRRASMRPRRRSGSSGAYPSSDPLARAQTFWRNRHSHSSGKPSVPAAANADPARFRACACGSRRAVLVRPRTRRDRPEPVPQLRSIPGAAPARAVWRSARTANCAGSSATAVLPAQRAIVRARRVQYKPDCRACRGSSWRSNAEDPAGLCSPFAANFGTPRASSVDRYQPMQRWNARCAPRPPRPRSVPPRRPDRGRCSDIRRARLSTR